MGQTMTDTEPTIPPTPDTHAGEPERVLSPAATRALAEAAERRAATEQKARATEVGGRQGPDPVRYGDWERGGIASDF